MIFSATKPNEWVSKKIADNEKSVKFLIAREISIKVGVLHELEEITSLSLQRLHLFSKI